MAIQTRCQSCLELKVRLHDQHFLTYGDYGLGHAILIAYPTWHGSNSG